MPPVRMVMETISRECDLFGGLEVCSAFSRGEHFEPEYHVREAVLSFLTTCLWSQCVSLDIGANIGQFSVMMASLGSRVIAVEGQIALAEALNKTVELNCWGDRFTVLNSYITLEDKEHGKLVDHDGSGGRPIMAEHPASRWNEVGDSCCTQKRGTISLVSWSKLLLDVGRIHFIKIDIDSFEVALVDRMEELISAGSISVQTVVAELKGYTPSLWKVLSKLFDHGYSIYVLNLHLDRRWFDARGWDVYSNYSREPVQELHPPGIEEYFAQRFMRYILYISPNTSEENFKLFSERYGDKLCEFLITKEKLLEPRFEYPYRETTDTGAIEHKTIGQTSFGYKNSATGVRK